MTRLVAGVSSSVGLVRSANEDSFLVREGLYVVCDGMGGARAGEVASEMACRGLMQVDPATDSAGDLLKAVQDANRSIAVRSHEHEGLLGMGTTLTGGLVKGSKLSLVHVGDSRAYLLHAGELTQLTEDHSWVGEMVRRGELTPQEAAVHPHRSVITRALGTDPDVDPDVFDVEVADGDRLLLCSDGLSGMVSDSEIERILAIDEPPQQVAAALVDAALAAGGEDNVTVVVVDFRPQEPDDAKSETKAAEGPEVNFGPSDRGAPSGVATQARRRLARRQLPFLRAGDQAPAPAPAADNLAAVAAVASAEGAGGEAPAQPVARSKWGRKRWVFVIVAAIIVIVAMIGVFAVVNSTMYYVGASGNVVALYQGLPGSILGIDLSQRIEQSAVSYSSLAQSVKSQIDAHKLVTKEEGQRFIRTLVAAP